MKAIIWTAYGPPDVLQLKEVETPAPKDNEVRIRIQATTVTSGDCEQRSLNLPFWYALAMRAYVGLDRPRIGLRSGGARLGMELAGEIDAVGSRVQVFKPGDRVFAATGLPGMGTCAEYICLPEEPEGGALALAPANMSYEQAAAVPVGGLEALAFLRQGSVQRGQRLLINGAGGTIGTFAVQLAGHFGAKVTAVDSVEKLDMLRALGADQVLDYTSEDFTRRGETYDFILDVTSKASFSGCLRSLEPGGRYLIANPGPAQVLRGRWASATSRKKVLSGAADPRTKDLLYLRDLVEAGHLKTVIDRCYPLEETAEAHRYVETGRKIGHVIITVSHDPDPAY